MFFPFISSCSSGNKTSIEVISPPIYPKEFSTIPAQVEKPQLIALLSVEQKVKDINFGRNDPFLPAQINDKNLSIPHSFIFHGQISSDNNLNAFVSYKNQSGTIKPGDIGGESTNLLPPGWIVERIDTETQVLILAFDDRSVEIDLFPIQKTLNMAVETGE